MLIVLIPSLHDFQLFNEKMYLIYKLAIIIFQIILQKCEWLWYVYERGINFLFVHLSASLGVLSWCNFRKFQSGKSAKSVVFILLPKSKPFYFHIKTILTSLITWTLIWADRILFWAISLKKTQPTCSESNNMAVCTLHQVSSVSRSVWRWVITDHTAHSFEGLEHRE